MVNRDVFPTIGRPMIAVRTVSAFSLQHRSLVLAGRSRGSA
jgi:hypothetical protein